MDQAFLDQVLYWLLLPFELLHSLLTTVVFCIRTALSWLHEMLHYFWTIVVFGIAVAFSKLLIPFYALCDLPYLWLRAIFGVSIGLFVARKTVGLLVCVLGNAALFALVSWISGPPENLIVLLSWSIFAFWLAGRILRWIFLRVPGGRPLVVAGAMIVVGLSLLEVALHHNALVWWVVRIAGIGLAAAGGILATFGLQALWEERIALWVDDWRFRRSLRY